MIRKRWLYLIRVSWVIALLVSLAVAIFALPGYFDSDKNFFQQSDTPDSLSMFQIGARWVSGILSIASTLLSIALAVLIYWRKPGEAMAVFFSFYLLFYAIFLTGPIEALNAYWLPDQPELALKLQSVFFSLPNIVLLLVFPNGTFQPGWTRFFVWLGLAFTAGALLVDSGELLRPTTLVGFLWVGLLYGLLLLSLVVQIYRYVVIYTFAERQQAKWAVYGILVWAAAMAVSSVPFYYVLSLPADQPTPWWGPFGSTLWFLSLAVLPVSFSVAILRSRLWDIDFIVRRTLLYTLLTGLLALVYFGTVTLLQSFFAAVIGHQSTAAIVVSTLTIAALFNPLRGRLQDLLDRRFYRQKYDAESALADFAEAARSETNLEYLSTQLTGTIQASLQPAHTSLWIMSFNSSSGLAQVERTTSKERFR